MLVRGDSELPSVTRQPVSQTKLNALEFTAGGKALQFLRSRKKKEVGIYRILGSGLKWFKGGLFNTGIYIYQNSLGFLEMVRQES